MDERSVKYWMWRVYQEAKNSPDQSTKNGAAVIKGGCLQILGYNHFTRGYKSSDPKNHERPFKYSIMEHAERNVIYACASAGISTLGSTMVANWIACDNCARAIVRAGIRKVICHKECMDRTPERWRENVDLGLSILEKGYVEVVQWSGKVGVLNLNNGEWWEA